LIVFFIWFRSAESGSSALFKFRRVAGRGIFFMVIEDIDAGRSAYHFGDLGQGSGHGRSHVQDVDCLELGAVANGNDDHHSACGVSARALAALGPEACPLWDGGWPPTHDTGSPGLFFPLSETQTRCVLFHKGKRKGKTDDL